MVHGLVSATFTDSWCDKAHLCCLFDMGFDLSGSDLAETMHDEVAQNWAVRWRAVTTVCLNTEPNNQSSLHYAVMSTMCHVWLQRYKLCERWSKNVYADTQATLDGLHYCATHCRRPDFGNQELSKHNSCITIPLRYDNVAYSSTLLSSSAVSRSINSCCSSHWPCSCETSTRAAAN